jgi:hypothetical protein
MDRGQPRQLQEFWCSRVTVDFQSLDHVTNMNQKAY